MKYTISVEIDCSRTRVLDLFDSPEQYSAWQETLVEMERLEGESGQVGAEDTVASCHGQA